MLCHSEYYDQSAEKSGNRLTLIITSTRNSYDKLFKKIGMAVPKSIQMRVGMIEINQV